MNRFATEILAAILLTAGGNHVSGEPAGGLEVAGATGLNTTSQANDAAGHIGLKEFKQEIWAPARELIMGKGTTDMLGVVVQNVSNVVWPAKGPSPVYFSYHWLDSDGKVVVWDGERTPLPHDLQPGQSVLLTAKVRAPDSEANYVLRATMVQEGIAWFEDRGARPVDVQVRVVSVR